jgi:predicted small integral membrane protein
MTEVRDQKSEIGKAGRIAMTKKIILFALCSLLLAPCSASDAQQPTKIPRIGFLDRSTGSGSALLLETFRQELSKLGWIEGKSITIDY